MKSLHKPVAGAVAAVPDAPMRNWLEETAVVGLDGEPCVVYHGSRSDELITEFQGVSYFSDSTEFAQRFGSTAVYPVYLNIRNPYRIDGAVSGRHFRWDHDDIEEFAASGYDGIVVTHSDGNVYVPFEGSQVRSIFYSAAHAAHELVTSPAEEGPAWWRNGAFIGDPLGRLENADVDVASFQAMLEQAGMTRGEVTWRECKVAISDLFPSPVDSFVQHLALRGLSLDAGPTATRVSAVASWFDEVGADEALRAQPIVAVLTDGLPEVLDGWLRLGLAVHVHHLTEIRALCAVRHPASERTLDTPQVAKSLASSRGPETSFDPF